MSVRPLEFLKNAVSGGRRCDCQTCPLAGPVRTRKVILIGAPNVGKSVIFNSLTGRYAVVSNYPGTTVEISRGQSRIGDMLLDVVDSPGTYSLAPLSEDERVTQDVLVEEPSDLVVHVVDARNLRRMLPVTLQLIEAGLPVALDINVIDEAQRAGIAIDPRPLAKELDLAVIPTAAATGFGMDNLRSVLAAEPPRLSDFRVSYPDFIEAAVADIGELLTGRHGLSARAVALLLLQRDPAMWERVTTTDPEHIQEIGLIVSGAEAESRQPLAYPIAVARQREADRLATKALRPGARPARRSFREVLGALAIHPIAGIPLLAAVLYFGLYLFVGKLGAGVVVDFLEKKVFVQFIDPAVTGFFQRLLPWPVISDLFVGEYGIFTLGVRYAIAIVLPLVGAFFLMFSLLEDSGYLPRLALLVDRIFKRIGLSGRAVIPLVLGLGCDTMATLVTRVLETRRERMIATFLLALAIPCSAQLGVILGLLSTHPVGLLIWGGVVGGVLLFSGYLASKLLPGEAARFHLEIPPMRVPSVRNVGIKTLARLKWYAAEVIPIFLGASVAIWLAERIHLFPLVLAGLRPAVHAIGLPDAAADALLFGFFRRDYGAARIFDIHSSGAVSGIPLVVAMVTITLFVPCIAQFLVMVRERGARAALAVAAIILPLAFGVGFVLNIILRALNVHV